MKKLLSISLIFGSLSIFASDRCGITLKETDTTKNDRLVRVLERKGYKITNSNNSTSNWNTSFRAISYRSYTIGPSGNFLDKGECISSFKSDSTELNYKSKITFFDKHRRTYCLRHAIRFAKMLPSCEE